MSSLQCANIHFESTQNNRVQYLGANNFAFVTAGSNSLVINTTCIALATTVGIQANGSVGTSGQVLTSNATTVYWASPAASGVTSVATGNGLTGGTITTTGTISVLANTGLVANSTGVHINSSSNQQFGSVGVGTAASGTSGEIRATNNITAYYSDERLKEILGTIPDALSKLMTLSGIIYKNNELAKKYGYKTEEEQVGVVAQEIEKVLPQIVKMAPFDSEYIDGVEHSKSGENFKTVQYEKIIPLLIEAIKEQQNQIQELKQIINNIKTP